MATRIITKNGSGAPLASDLQQGELAVDLTNKRLYTEDSLGAVQEVGVNPAAEITANGGIALPDNQKATFGASDDLQIYHDGSHSYVKDNGTGNLRLQGATTIQITDPSFTSYSAQFDPTGAATFYHNNSAKLATTSTGIDVTGTVTADGLTVDGRGAIYSGVLSEQSQFRLGYSSDYHWSFGRENATTGDLFIESSTTGTDTTRLRVGASGDISFYNTAGTSQSFFWDASAESLGIGTTSPSAKLDVNGQLSSATAGTATIGYTFGGQTTKTGMGCPADGTLSFYAGTSTERMRIDSSGNVGIGIASPDEELHIATTGSQVSLKLESSSQESTIFNNINASFGVLDGATERLRVDTSGNLLVGTTSTSLASNDGINLLAGGIVASSNSNGESLNLNRRSSDGDIAVFRKDGTTVGSIGKANGGASQGLYISGDDVGFSFEGNTNNAITPYSVDTGDRDAAIDLGSSSARFKDLYLSNQAFASYFGSSGDTNTNIYFAGGDQIRFITGGSEAARFDASGNLLVGKTSTDFGVAGTIIESDGTAQITRSSGAGLNVNRISTNGNIANFYRSGTLVGSMGIDANGFYLDGESGHAGIKFTGNAVIPRDGAADVDGTVNLGASAGRYQDIYATNGTIQTSDANEKQDIDVLSEAEQRVAVACKGLLRKFRWKSSVAEKGDDARIHFGIIAQDLQAAFEAEGLDAGDYAMFIHSTWTDEETGEERSRMGVRYSELLAFIIAAI